MKTVRSSGPTASPAMAMLRGGAVPAGVLSVVAGLALIPSGGAAAASALLGGGLATVALAVGPVILHVVRTWAPPAVMAAALTGFGVTVFVFGVVFSVLSVQDWVRGGPVALGIVAAAVASMVGQLRAVTRLRVLVYEPADVQGKPGVSPDDSQARGVRPASPSEDTH